MEKSSRIKELLSLISKALNSSLEGGGGVVVAGLAEEVAAVTVTTMREEQDMNHHRDSLSIYASGGLKLFPSKGHSRDNSYGSSPATDKLGLPSANITTITTFSTVPPPDGSPRKLLLNPDHLALLDYLTELASLTHNCTTPFEGQDLALLIDTLQPLYTTNTNTTNTNRNNDKAGRLAIACLGNICKSAKVPMLQRILGILANVLYNSSNDQLLAASFKSLSLVTNENPKLANEAIISVLPVIEKFVFMEELQGQVPSSSSELTTNSTSTSVLGVRRSFGNLIQSSLTDDSEPSDNEQVKSSRSKFRPEWKVQYQALVCLESLARQCPKQMHSQWSKFLPGSVEVPKSLMYILLHHSSENVRGAACKAVVSFFTDSKQYLSIAANGNRASSFTSLSQLLANQLYVTIVLLFKAFKWQSSYNLLFDLYSVLNVILRNCTLKNLQGNLNSATFALLNEEIARLDNRQLHLPLDCLSLLIHQIDPKEHYLLFEKSFQIVFSHCTVLDPIIFSSILNILASLGAKSPSLTWSKWTQIYPIITTGLSSSSTPVLLAALKALEHFAHASLDPDLNYVLDVNWWTLSLENTAHLWMMDLYALRCVTCHLLGHLSSSATASLKPRMIAMVISTILSFSQDEHPDVRAAACGTLGILISHICIHTDDNFMFDIASRLPALCGDTNLKVRVRAFWAMGALADTLGGVVELDTSNGESSESLASNELLPSKGDVLVRRGENPPSLPNVPESVKLNLLRSAVAGCSDQEKVRSHAFRALGRLVPLMSADTLYANIPLLGEATSSLVSNMSTGAFKTRWNACHCIRHLIACDRFPLGINFLYSVKLYKALIDVSVSSHNFKVKTGALLALGTPHSLERYQTSETDAVEMIMMILKGLNECAQTIDKILVRAPIDDQKSLNQFLDAFAALLDHLHLITGNDLWTDSMKSVERAISLAVTKVGKATSSFDPKGA